MKALAAGVPMVLLPHGRDQADNAARVTARGAGVTLKRTARVEAIASAVRVVPENTGYRTLRKGLAKPSEGMPPVTRWCANWNPLPPGTWRNRIVKRGATHEEPDRIGSDNLLMNPSGLTALDGHKAAYAGGTIARFNNVTGATARAD